jgi:hypothetical protein
VHRATCTAQEQHAKHTAETKRVENERQYNLSDFKKIRNEIDCKAAQSCLAMVVLGKDVDER